MIICSARGCNCHVFLGNSIHDVHKTVGLPSIGQTVRPTQRDVFARTRLDEDKMSLPSMFWKVIMKSGAEVPWLFKVSRVDDLSRSRVSINANVNVTKQKQTPKLTKVLGGAIDFRSLNNYFFPWDVVSVRLIQDVPPIVRATASRQNQIHSNQESSGGAWNRVEALERIGQGGEDPVDYNGKWYWFNVVDLQSAPRGEKVDMAKVQDCDIAKKFGD
eukprot:CAMPEP_0194399526 /NCGR_PEP_ID=MMETSP0174-20130528/126710_1 /TAXON_ID=216777 /ORGANISM="Proboscia alata, Strain PI-D3" /LENGTH=216 /DNA_ID=CAMNT_0039195947 /DNA_START=758 /DNA_END=1411 /DNA_ORIENTATION=+